MKGVSTNHVRVVIHARVVILLNRLLFPDMGLNIFFVHCSHSLVSRIPNLVRVVYFDLDHEIGYPQGMDPDYTM